MAISITNIASAGDTTDGTVYTIAGETLEAGRLYLLSVCAAEVDTASTPTIASNLGTWALRESVDFQSIASPDQRLCIFTGTVSGQDTSDITITYGSTKTACRWSLEEVTGHNTASPIVQDGENRADTGTSFSVTLAAFADAVNNAMYCVVSHSSVDAINKEAAHTQLSDGATAPASGQIHMKAVWFLGEDTSIDFTTASNRIWGGVALEIAVAPAAGGPSNANKVQRSSKHTSRLAVV